MVDIEKIRSSIVNRKERHEVPFVNFYDQYLEAEVACKKLLNNEVDKSIGRLIGKAAVITVVSALEVYYKDMFSWCLFHCDRKIFKNHWKKLYDKNLSIEESISLFDEELHPLNLVANYQSFQNTEKINKVFGAIFFNGDLWKYLYSYNIRRKDQPDKIVTWTKDDFMGMKRTIELRHQLIHDSKLSFEVSEELYLDLSRTAHMVWGSHFAITQKVAKLVGEEKP